MTTKRSVKWHCKKPKKAFAKAEVAWKEVRSHIQVILPKLRKTDNSKEDLQKIKELYISEIRPRINLITTTIHEVNAA